MAPEIVKEVIKESISPISRFIEKFLKKQKLKKYRRKFFKFTRMTVDEFDLFIFSHFTNFSDDTIIYILSTKSEYYSQMKERNKKMDSIHEKLSTELAELKDQRKNDDMWNKNEILSHRLSYLEKKIKELATPKIKIDISSEFPIGFSDKFENMVYGNVLAFGNQE